MDPGRFSTSNGNSRRSSESSSSSDSDLSTTLSNLSMEQSTGQSRLSSQHPVLCSLLQSPCQDSLIVTTRRQLSQEVGGLQELQDQ